MAIIRRKKTKNQEQGGEEVFLLQDQNTGYCPYNCLFKGDRVYKCSTGNNTCKIENNTRKACKKCRYRSVIPLSLKPGMWIRFDRMRIRIQARSRTENHQSFQKVKNDFKGGGADVPLFETIKTNAGTQPKNELQQ